jgi:hypothetical protein
LAGKSIGQGNLDRTAVLGLAGAESGPPGFAPALQTGADHGLCDIAGAWCPGAQDGDHQPVAKQESSTTRRQGTLCFGTLHQGGCEVEQGNGRDQPGTIVARRRCHSAQASQHPAQPRPIGIWRHYGCGVAELSNAAGDGARVIALAQMGDIGLDAGTGDAIPGRCCQVETFGFCKV